MTQLLSYISAHQTLFALAGYYVLSAGVGSLPMPDASSGKFYRWFFQFSNTLGANITRAYASKLPKESPPAN